MAEKNVEEQPDSREPAAAEADALFKEGVKLVLKDPSEAVELLGKLFNAPSFPVRDSLPHVPPIISLPMCFNPFSQCLEIRNKLYGNEALECAETYYQYGRALLEQARESTDALGSSKVREDVRKEEAKLHEGAGPSVKTGTCERRVREQVREPCLHMCAKGCAFRSGCFYVINICVCCKQMGSSPQARVPYLQGTRADA
eukprot:1160805-Pelagomonas_calceolata.AAC.6